MSMASIRIIGYSPFLLLKAEEKAEEKTLPFSFL